MPRHELSAFEKHIRRIIAQNLKSASWGMTQAELGGQIRNSNLHHFGVFCATFNTKPGKRPTPSRRFEHAQVRD